MSTEKELIPYSPEWYQQRKEGMRNENIERLKNDLSCYNLNEIIEILDHTWAEESLVECFSLYIIQKTKLIQEHVLGLLNNKKWHDRVTGEKAIIDSLLECMNFDCNKADLIKQIKKGKISITVMNEIADEIDKNFYIPEN